MADLIYGLNPVREALRGARRRPLELTIVAGARPPRLAELVAAATAATSTASPAPRTIRGRCSPLSRFPTAT